VSLFPEVRLVMGKPHRLRFGLEVGHRFPHAGNPEGHSPEPPQGLQPLGAPLVEPDDGGAEGPPLPVEIDDGGALGSQGHAGDGFGTDIRFLPELPARPAEGLPEVVRLLLRPARFPGKIGLDHYPRFGPEVAPGIEDQGPDALGAVVDGQYQFAGGFSHRSAGSFPRCWWSICPP